MNIDLHDRAALIDAITVGADRPIAFLVGSPLSWDAGGGVPGVDDMVAIAKELVKAKLPIGSQTTRQQSRLPLALMPIRQP